MSSLKVAGQTFKLLQLASSSVWLRYEYPLALPKGDAYSYQPGCGTIRIADDGFSKV